MRKKYFLAIIAALAIGMTAPAPLSVYATTVDESDEEDAEGEQSTEMADDDTEDEDVQEEDADDEVVVDEGDSDSDDAPAQTTPTTSTAKSSDSSLSHMSIAPGSLSPAFSSGTYEYQASVDANVTAISVAAKPNSSKAVIAAVSGAKSLSAGKNTVKVIVEAENGTTSTYTIIVTCGSSAATSTTPAPETGAETDTNAVEGEITETEISGEISTDDKSEKKESDKKNKVTFDSNGYLIYEGEAYIPSEMMPEGEYVSLDKYNKLYDQAQEQKTSYMRIIIILVIVLLVALIVILNLALKLRDMRQDAMLGIVPGEDDEIPVKRMKADKKADKTPEMRKPGKAMEAEHVSPAKAQPTVKNPIPAKPATKPQVKEPVASKAPAKTKMPEKKAAHADSDLEILDLNEL